MNLFSLKYLPQICKVQLFQNHLDVQSVVQVKLRMFQRRLDTDCNVSSWTFYFWVSTKQSKAMDLKVKQLKNIQLTYEGSRRLRKDEGDSFIFTMGLKFGERTMLLTKGEKFRTFFGAVFWGLRNFESSDLFDIFGDLAIRTLLSNVTFGDTKSVKKAAVITTKSNFIEMLFSTYNFRLAPWLQLKLELAWSLRNTFKVRNQLRLKASKIFLFEIFIYVHSTRKSDKHWFVKRESSEQW